MAVLKAAWADRHVQSRRMRGVVSALRFFNHGAPSLPKSISHGRKTIVTVSSRTREIWLGRALAAFFMPRSTTDLAMEVIPVVGFQREPDRRPPAVNALSVGQDRKEQSAYDGHARLQQNQATIRSKRPCDDALRQPRTRRSLCLAAAV
jgi:hypothetical protein